MFMDLNRGIDPLHLWKGDELILTTMHDDSWCRNVCGGFIRVVLETIVIEAAMERDISKRGRDRAHTPPQFDRHSAIPLTKQFRQIC